MQILNYCAPSDAVAVVDVVVAAVVAAIDDSIPVGTTSPAVPLSVDLIDFAFFYHDLSWMMMLMMLWSEADGLVSRWQA